MNIFEQAARLALRFPSARGDLTTEQLFDLPLQSKTGFDLDNVAKAVNTSLKAAGEESFVKTTPNPQKDLLALRLEIVKFVIADKIAAAATARDAQARKAEKDQLLSILADKNQEALKSLTREELQDRINKL